MYCAPTTLEQLSPFRIHTNQGTTYVIPRNNCGHKAEECICVLENSNIVSLIAQGHQVKNVRYIDDSARPVLLVEI